MHKSEADPRLKSSLFDGQSVRRWNLMRWELARSGREGRQVRGEVGEDCQGVTDLSGLTSIPVVILPQ